MDNGKSGMGGGLPEGWVVKELGKIAKITSGGTPSRIVKSYWDGDIPWITTSLIDFNEIEGAEEFITAEGLRNSSTKLFPPGTLLMALYGQGKTRGKTAILKIEASTNQACAAIILDEQQANKQYIFQYLVSKYDDIRNLSNTGNQENLNGELVKSIRLNIPPLSEQTAIAHVLGLMDKAIQLNEQVIAQKELRKKWLMQQLLTGKRRVKGFGGAWMQIPISELLEEVHRYAEWKDDSLYKLVSIRRRFGGLFERGDLFGHQIEVKKIKSTHYKDFLVSKRQVSHGAWGIVTPKFHDFKVSDEYDCLVVKDENKLDIHFWDWLCKTPLLTHLAYLSSNGVHLEKMIFDFDTFKKRKVFIPKSITEQTAVAQILQAADKELGLLRAKGERLREQKKGVMGVLLTGRKRLKIK